MPRTTVAFQGGTYGMYVQWVLYSLLVDGPVQSPFEHSTSHSKSYIDKKFIDDGIILRDHATIDNFHSNSNLQLSVIHPITQHDQKFHKEMNMISDLVDRVIIPYCDHATYLLCVNNYMLKIFLNRKKALHWISPEDIKRGWGMNYDQAPPWVLREYYSMNVFDTWNQTIDWFAPDHYHNPKCLFVFVHDLFYNFIDTVEQIRQHLEVEWIRDPAELLPLHQRNISNQTYKSQDRMAQSILNSVCGGPAMDWVSTSITVYTEAYIQRRLQQLGYMLKCNELNVFPTSTEQLLEACA